MSSLDILVAAVAAQQASETALAGTGTWAGPEGDTDGTSDREDDDVDDVDDDDDDDDDGSPAGSERPFACGFCSKRFARSDGAKVHEKVGHR